MNNGNDKINVNEIKILWRKYNMKNVEIYTSDKIRIVSQYDEWIAEFHSSFYIYLKHINNKDSKTRSHLQRRFRDLEYMFKSINQHDRYVHNKQKAIPKKSRIEMLYQQIASNY